MTNKNFNFKSFAPDNASGMHRDWTGNGPALPRRLFTLLFVLLLGFGQMWGQVASATATNGGTYVVCAYSNSTYYALPNNTSAGTWDGTAVTVNGSGQVTTANAPTWTLVVNPSNSNQYYLTYKNGNSTYYLYKNGTNNSNRNIKGDTSDKNYWTFTAGTDGNAGKYSVHSERGSGYNTELKYASSKWKVDGTSASYTIILLPVAPAGPTITTSSSMSTFGCNMTNGAPNKQSFKVSGAALTANVTVTPPTGYEVCLSENGTYTSSVTLNKGTGTLAETSVYVKLKDNNAAGSYSGNITCESSGATTQNVAVSGSTPFKVTWQANGQTHATTYVAYAANPGTAIGTFPDDPDPDDYTCSGTNRAFYGWYNGASYKNANTAPDIITTSTKITSDKTFNAVFADASGGGSTTKWVLTSLNAVTEGTYALMTGDYHAFNGSISSGKGGITTNAFSFTNGEATSAPTGTCEITFQAVTGGFKMYNSSNGYLYAKGNTSGNLGWHNSESSYWSYASSNWVYNSNSARLRSYNDGNFNTYSSDNGNLITLAKKTTVSNTTYSNYMTTCCTPLGQINGSFSLTQLDTPTEGKLKASWELGGTTGIESLTLQLWKKGDTDTQVGDDIDVTINTSAQTHTFEDLDYCATYYATLIATEDGGTYCSGGTGWTETSDEVTTIGYAVELTDDGSVTGGSFSTDKARACAGDEVTLTATPASGYLLGGWTVLDGNSDEISAKSTTTNTFVFDMPASGVIAEATFCTQPTAPTGLSYTLNADETRGKTVLSWTAVAGATGYELSYSKDNVAQTPIDVNTNSYTFNPLAVGVYTWSVKAINGCGESTAVDGKGFIICPDISSASVTIADVTPVYIPASNTWSAAISWTAVDNATAYQYKLIRTTDSETIIAETTTTGTSIEATGLTNAAAKNYKFSIKAKNACDELMTNYSEKTFDIEPVHTLAYDANGGSSTPSSEYKAKNASVTAAAAIEKTGDDFIGWKRSDNDEIVAAGASFSMPDANLTLTAQWQIKSFTVTFNKNHEDATGEMTNQVHDYSTTPVALTTNTFAREGHQFMGWATTSTGGVVYADGADYTFTASAELFAVWAPKYTVNWIVNSTTKTTQTAIAGTALEEPYAPQSSDCDGSKVFVGWTETQHYSNETDAPGDLFDYANTMTMPVNGATYYAVFANEVPGTEDVHAQTTFSSKGWETVTEGDATWTSGKDGNQMQSGRGVQVTTGVSGANATTDDSYNAVSSVVITYSTNANKGIGSIAIKVGTTDYTTENNVTVNGGTDDRTATFTAPAQEDDASGAVQMTVTCTENSIYVKSVTINYTEDATVRTNYTTDCSTSLPTCEAPAFDVDEGEYTVVKNVTITCATEDATIYYTTDGSNPATSGTKETYGSTPVRVDHTLTLKAVAVKENCINSSVTSADYTITLPQCATPTISLVSGYYSGVQSVTLTCETANASIYYTTDGNDPTTGSTLYTGAIDVDADITLKAVAIAENTTLSAIASADYIIVTAGSTVWELVSNVNDLKDGDIIVIASNAEGKTMSSTITSSICSPIATTFSANKSIIESLGAGSGQFTLSKSGDNWKMYNASGYLSSTTNKQMSYVAQAANATAWTISISSNDATINAGGSIGKIMHNTNQPRFTTYTSDASATMLLPQIYRKSVVCEDPDDELAFASSVPAAITNAQTAQLATTGGNGEDVVYTVISANAANATISNDNKFSATAAGTYTVQAKQEISADYKCAQVVTMDITVTVLVNSVELNKEELTLEVGQFETLVATVLPADAANKNVTWSVLTEGSVYVEVDANGKVTGKAVGNGVVQVTTEDGNKTATCAVTVTAPTPVLTLTADNPLEFGNVEPNKTKDLTINLKGSYLVADATYSITGDDVFTVETALDNDVIGTEGGQTLTIRFAPTAEGDKSATITFSSEGAEPVALAVTGTGKKRYTATLHAGNGSVASEPVQTVQEASIGAGITLPAATLSQTLQDGGWSFVGWAEAALDNETAETPTTHTGAYAIAADIDLYAIYKRTDVVEKTASKNSGFTSYYNVTIEAGKPITFTASSGSAETNHIRVHANNTLTVNGGGATIKKVEFVSLSSYKATNFSVNSVNLTGEVWEGSASSVVFTAGSQVRFSSIAVTYQTSAGLYTTYPAELFTVEYALNGGTGNFSNQTVTKGSSYTIDATEPTKENHDFLGWSDGTTTYQAAETIENIQGDITLTAQWQEWFKATTITFKNGENTVETKENIYKGESYTTPEAPNVDGKLFQGWSDGENTVAAETEVAVPNDLTENITITYNALWQDILPTPTAPQINAANLANGEWVLVTAAGQINAGDVVIIAATEYDYALGLQGTNDYRAREAVVKTTDKSKLTTINNAAKLFVQHGSAAEQYSLYDINTATGENGYLFDPNVSGKNYVRTKTTIAQDCSWIIALSENGATIKSATSNKWLKYNSSSGSERFSCYGTEGYVAIYKWVKKITGTTPVDASTITLTDAVIVTNGATLNVNTDTELENVIVENGGKVDADATLTVNDLTLQSVSGGFEVTGTSGEVTGSGAVTVSGDIYLEIKLCEYDENIEEENKIVNTNGFLTQKGSQNWYCISAPFEVAINDGFFWGDGTKMELNTHFQLFEWDGARRATGSSGWRRTSGNTKAGIAYFIGFDDERVGTTAGMNQNVIKLKALNKNISTEGTIDVKEYTTNSAGSNYENWNGLGNPRLHHIALDQSVQAFNYNKQTYSSYPSGEYNFVVGTPFFIQGTTDLTIETANNAEFRAPKREVEEDYMFRVRIGKSGEAIADNHVYVRASDNAISSFEEGHDMPTMNGTTASSALIWTENYGMRLAIEEAPLVNGTASYVLTLSAPANGTYSISVAAAHENADLYLTYEGAIIWNLSMGAYTMDLNKGITNGYGLLLQAKAPNSATGVDEVTGDGLQVTGAQKVIIDEHVYILRGGQMYDVNGKMVK